MFRRGSADTGSGLLPPPKTWLNRRRREAQIDQDALADVTGISPRTLQRLESGEVSNPPLRCLVSCAAALGLEDWHDLLEDAWLEPLNGDPSRRARTSPFVNPGT